MIEKAKLTIGDKTIDLHIIEGSEGEKAIDITELRNKTGLITIDPGYGNTGACLSGITFLDGEKGILRYRGYPVEILAEKARFIEVAYLLIYGELPNKQKLESFSHSFTKNCMIHEDMKNFFNGYPPSAHPMLILSAMIASLSSYYPELAEPDASDEVIDTIAVEIISKVRTIAAFSYKKSKGEPFIYPKTKLKYIQNFLHMMFSTPYEQYEIDEDIVKALEVLFILHADHEQNCSTSTVRLVGSSKANLFSSISSGISALWGPLHGGANQKVIEMLDLILKDGGDIKKYIEMAKDKKSGFRLMGFGHRVYRNYDPRAKIIKKYADLVLNKMNIKDPMLDLAYQIEEIALKDNYFIDKKLYPNVDFYSGIIYKAIGIPINMFPVMFAMARIPGWIAQWREMKNSKNFKIGRPRQIYMGYKKRDFVDLENRK